MTIYSWVSQTSTKQNRRSPEEEEAAALARERRQRGQNAPQNVPQTPLTPNYQPPKAPASSGGYQYHLAPEGQAAPDGLTKNPDNQIDREAIDRAEGPLVSEPPRDFSETAVDVDTGDVDGDGIPNDEDETPYGENSEPPQETDANNLEAQFSAEQQALEEEFAAAEARALLDARARSGAAGFGLSGAQQGLEADIRRVMTREEALSLADLARGYRDEGRSDRQLDISEQEAENREYQFELERMQLEPELGADLNGDGIIGVGVDAATPEEAEDDAARAEMDAIYATVGGTGADNDEYGGFNGMSAGQLTSLVAAGAQFTITSVYSDGFGGMNVEARDQFGNMIKVEVPSDQDDNEDTATAWFNSVAGG